MRHDRVWGLRVRCVPLGEWVVPPDDRDCGGV